MILLCYTFLRRPFCRGTFLYPAGFRRFSSRSWNDCSPKVCYCCLSLLPSDVCSYHCHHPCGIVSSAATVCYSWNWIVPSRNRHSDNSLVGGSSIGCPCFPTIPRGERKQQKYFLYYAICNNNIIWQYVCIFRFRIVTCKYVYMMQCIDRTIIL